jgi:hypothetical protein
MPQRLERSPARGNTMIYHILFWTLCAVLVAHVIVAVIAVIRAYRHEGRLFFSKPIFQNGHETQKDSIF